MMAMAAKFGLKSHEKPLQFMMLVDAFTVENGTLTTTDQLKRDVLKEKFKD